jgi:stearoyl-CoA desaturase (delta-9 desaturase)
MDIASAGNARGWTADRPAPDHCHPDPADSADGAPLLAGEPLARPPAPALIACATTREWMGALLGLIWGGLLRVFFVHHLTWSVNSICHQWGSRPFSTHDRSRKNAIFGVLALGEGWRNNHDAFPTSARHGLERWPFDARHLLIRGLALLGLARDVKVPSPERIAAKRVRRSDTGQHTVPS